MVNRTRCGLFGEESVESADIAIRLDEMEPKSRVSC